MVLNAIDSKFLVPHYEVCISFETITKDSCGTKVKNIENIVLGERKVSTLRNKRELSAANKYQTHNANYFKVYFQTSDKEVMLKLLKSKIEGLRVEVKDYACPGYDLCGDIKDLEPFACEISNECIGFENDIGYFIFQSDHH